MPEIKPTSILSFSSEDKSFPADNLLKTNAFFKWKCKEAGEKQAIVVFKFDQTYKINRLDIGNEGAAFVEALVSRSSSGSDVEEILLPSSSFMSPADAKAGNSLNRVRIFGADELTSAVMSQKWDTVKVVCTQPFNKTIQYGLAFIRFYTPADKNDETADTPSTSSSAVDLTNESALKPGGLFKLAREASEKDEKPAETMTQKILSHNQTSDDNDGQSTEVKQQVLSPASTAKLKSTSTASAVKEPSKSPPPRTSTSMPAASNSADSADEQSTVSNSHPKRRKPLEGVVVAFSGYQNPFRTELRSMCLKMGAKYCQDWNDHCTHLICAFPNTPKWRAVKGIGVITSHKWIQSCYAAKRRVSWRPFRVGRAPSPPGHVSDTQDDEEEGDSSDWEQSIVDEAASDDWQPGTTDTEADDEITTEEDSDASADESGSSSDSDQRHGGLKRGRKPLSQKPSKHPKRPERDANKKVSKQSVSRKNKKDGGSWQPVRRKTVPSSKPAPVGDEPDDTDDEIRRHLGGSPSTTNGAQEPLPDLPDLFVGKCFYIFSKDLPEAEEQIIYRLIITFGGKVELYMSTNVDFVITKSSWCDDFDNALNVSSKIIFVKPDWLYACDKAAKLIPFQRYQVVG